ncbi:MAG TPA: TIGR01458 family HAD-type hydrolase, partial [Chromatiales bacterium]|nr:TIGR01458 family HAD-type hydrolase [Chromatiales bacterium]
MKAILFDLDGVLYEGDRPVEGAAESVAWCQQQGIPHLFITNTSSRPRSALVEKLARMNIRVEASAIFSPPVAARRWLENKTQGPVALFVPEATKAEFEGLDLLPEEAEKGAAAVVLGDLGEHWDFRLLNRAFRLMMSEARPPLVALGMTRYWRASDGLRLDVGPFVTALEYATGRKAVVVGKPA